MASNLKINVNGKEWPVAAEPGHAAALCADQRIAAARPALRLRAGAMRLLLGAADGVEIRSCVTPVRASPARRSRRSKVCRRCTREQKGLRRRPALHPLQQAFIDEQAAALRLLLQRHDHQGFRAAVAKSEADRSRDPRAHERPSLPLRHLSADHEGDPACVRQNGGRARMTRRPMTEPRGRHSPAATCSRAAAR